MGKYSFQKKKNKTTTPAPSKGKGGGSRWQKFIDSSADTENIAPAADLMVLKLFKLNSSGGLDALGSAVVVLKQNKDKIVSKLTSSVVDPSEKSQSRSEV